VIVVTGEHILDAIPSLYRGGSRRRRRRSSAVPEDQRADIDNGRIWLEGMHQMLERLDRLCVSEGGCGTPE
jgi:hypothetical protein